MKFRGRTAGPVMDSYLWGMHAAEGYLALGLPADALEEIERIESDRPPTALLELKKEIVVALRDWQRMKLCCEQLCQSMPWAPGWAVQLSHAVRLSSSPQEAMLVLLDAEAHRFPDHPAMHYNVARLDVVMGNLPAARVRIARACEQIPVLRETAKGDPDFAPLHAEL